MALAHCVFIGLDPGHDPAELSRVLDGLAALQPHIDGFLHFLGGPNVDLEQMSPEFDAGFVITFRDRAALARYAVDPRHKALGARLKGQCRAGGIKVFDIETPA